MWHVKRHERAIGPSLVVPSTQAALQLCPLVPVEAAACSLTMALTWCPLLLISFDSTLLASCTAGADLRWVAFTDSSSIELRTYFGKPCVFSADRPHRKGQAGHQKSGVTCATCKLQRTQHLSQAPIQILLRVTALLLQGQQSCAAW